jgi:hypothetical protein
MNEEAIVALWVGIAGFVTGAIAIVVACLARRDARKANEIAAAANRISEEANGLSKEANDISRSSADRAAESHDAYWQGSWVRPGVYELKNTGTSTTRNVRATVMVDGVEQVGTIEVLEPGEPLQLEFPTAAEAYAEDQRAQQRYEQELHESRNPRVNNLGASFATHYPTPPTPPMHGIHARVVWTTPLGAHKEQELTERFSSLGPE